MARRQPRPSLGSQGHRHSRFTSPGGIMRHRITSLPFAAGVVLLATACAETSTEPEATNQMVEEGQLSADRYLESGSSVAWNRTAQSAHCRPPGHRGPPPVAHPHLSLLAQYNAIIAADRAHASPSSRLASRRVGRGIGRRPDQFLPGRLRVPRGRHRLPVSGRSAWKLEEEGRSRAGRADRTCRRRPSGSVRRSRQFQRVDPAPGADRPGLLDQ